MLSFFQRKNVEEPQMSVAPQMSIAPKTTKTAYKPPTNLYSSIQQSVFPKFTAPTTQPRQTTQSQPQMSIAPRMSMAPKVQQPTSFKDRLAKVTANYKYPEANTQAWNNYLKPKQQQQKPMTPAVDYLSKLKALADQRKSNFTGQADEYAQQIGGLRDRTAERTKSLIPGMQAGFNTFKDNVMGQISAEEQATGEDIENVERTTGEALRASAEANREQNANLQNIFAGLGTLDSGAFQDAQINQSNKFTRGQQTMQAQKAQEVNELKRGLQTFRQQSIAAIQQEEMNLQARLVEIENTIDSNSTEYNLAIKQAYDDAKNAVSAIDQEYAQAEYEVNQREYELSQTEEQLSPGFLQSGQPQNRTDYEWMVNNPDKYKEAFQGGGQPELSAAQENKVQLATSGLRALDEIQAIIARDPNAVMKSAVPGQLGAREYSSAATRAVEGLLRARSGAAVPEQEIQRYMQANLPRVGDSQEAIQAKLSAFRRDLEDVARSGGSQLQTSQVASNNDPLGIL